MWWQKTNGMDKKESLRVWTKTNIAVHKKQVIEWRCVGQNWVTSVRHPPFPGSVALERISSSASSVQRPKRVPGFFAASQLECPCPLRNGFMGVPSQLPLPACQCIPQHEDLWWSLDKKVSFTKCIIWSTLKFQSGSSSLPHISYKRGFYCKSGDFIARCCCRWSPIFVSDQERWGILTIKTIHSSRQCMVM